MNAITTIVVVIHGGLDGSVNPLLHKTSTFYLNMPNLSFSYKMVKYTKIDIFT